MVPKIAFLVFKPFWELCLYLELLQVLGHLPLDLLQTEDVGLGVREGRVQDIDVGPVLLDTGVYVYFVKKCIRKKDV